MVAQVRTKEDAVEMTYIYKIASTGFRCRQLGKDAFERMQKGDYTNKPVQTRRIIKNLKEVEKIEKNIKGYDINAE